MNTKKIFAVTTLCLAMALPVAFAEGNPFDEVKPGDWDYKAIMQLVDQGIITDTHGLALGKNTYTRYELTPLVVEAVDKRYGANDTDQATIQRLYNNYTDAVLNYKADQDSKDRAAKNGGTDGQVAAKEQAQERRGDDDGEIEPKPPTQAELKEKMDKLVIDTTQVPSNQGVQLTYNGNRAPARADAQTEQARVEQAVTEQSHQAKPTAEKNLPKKQPEGANIDKK